MKTKILTLVLAFLAVFSGTTLAATVIDGIAYTLNPNNQTALVDAGGNYTDTVVIPASVTYENVTYSVTHIGINAFQNCTTLTSVTIPNSIVNIGNYAFQNCTGLTSVEIPNSVTSLGSYAFYDCKALTSITLSDNITSINDYTFNNCYELTSIDIPNSATSIGTYAFGSCKGLTSIVIPNSVTRINTCAFVFCSSLTSVTIGNNVTYLDGQAFNYCTGLTSVHIHDLAAWCNINCSNAYNNPLYYAHHLYLEEEEITDLVIPNTVTTIRRFAFVNCTGINSISIPSSVTSIEQSAFSGCSGLLDIYNYNSTPQSINANVFESVNSSFVTLHVPALAADDYRAADVWKDFYIETFSFNTFNITGSATNGKVIGTGAYSEGSVIELIAEPDKGYRFTQWSDGNTDNPRTITVTEDAEYTAMFVKVAFNITVNQDCNVTVQ